MSHVVLLGDSIFDNGAYVEPGGDVATRLKGVLGQEWQVTLAARDGAVIDDVVGQLRRLPAGATHLAISAGGNDALRFSSVLSGRAASVMDALAQLLGVRDAFWKAYRTLLDAAAAARLPVAICTIYDSQFPDPEMRRLANLALGVLNDAITREAAARRLPLIVLRVMFDRPELYANAIEPSSRGSDRIAAAIKALLERHDFGGPSAIYI